MIIQHFKHATSIDLSRATRMINPLMLFNIHHPEALNKLRA